MAYNLKSEEEVKEYVKNLGTEYRFGCFSEKNPEVCHLLGDYMESISKDFQKAGRIYRTNCDDYQYGRSCYKAGHYYFAGKGGLDKSIDTSHDYYEKGCKYGCVDSCFRSGVLTMMNLRSKKPNRDFSKGFEDLKKGCEGNNSEACHHLSALYMDGFGDKLQKDMTKAFDFANRACGLGNIPACVNVSIMYKRGEGVKKDLDKSEQYKNRAVSLKDEVDKKKQLVFQEGLSQT